MDRVPYEGKGNPAPFPFSGGRAAIAAWQKREDELLAAAEGLPASATVSKSDPANCPAMFPSGEIVDPELAKAWIDLPTDAASVRRTLAAMGHEAREIWLMKLVLASTRLGGLSADVLIAALQDVHQMQLDGLMQRNGELERDNRELNAKLNRLELQGIDLDADAIMEDAHAFIREEVVRQVEALERRITKAAVGVNPPISEIEKLHARTVLDTVRIGELEQLSPLWVQIHTKQAG